MSAANPAGASLRPAGFAALIPRLAGMIHVIPPAPSRPAARHRTQRRDDRRRRRLRHDPAHAPRAARPLRPPRLARRWRADDRRRPGLERARRHDARLRRLVPLPARSVRALALGPAHGVSVCLAVPPQRPAQDRLRPDRPRDILQRPRSRVRHLQRALHLGAQGGRRRRHRQPGATARAERRRPDPRPALSPGDGAGPAHRRRHAGRRRGDRLDHR